LHIDLICGAFAITDKRGHKTVECVPTWGLF